MISITRRFEFDYGHRVLGHEGKCANLHGHRGVAEVTVVPIKADPQSLGLDSLGRVIDFACLKQVVGEWIDKHWDHNMIVHSDDPLILTTVFPNTVLSHTKDVRCGAILGGKAPYVLVDMNPTAENLAMYLHTKVDELLKSHHLRCVNVRFRETPNCWSDSRDLL